MHTSEVLNRPLYVFTNQQKNILVEVWSILYIKMKIWHSKHYSSYIVVLLSDTIIARIIVDYVVRVVKVDTSWLTCTQEVASMHNTLLDKLKMLQQQFLKCTTNFT